jgi:hypothetical protein
MFRTFNMYIVHNELRNRYCISLQRPVMLYIYICKTSLLSSNSELVLHNIDILNETHLSQYSIRWTSYEMNTCTVTCLYRHMVPRREKRDLERKCWEIIEISVKVVCCVQSWQPDQYILYCDQSHYRIYYSSWPALYTRNHLHLTFKSFSANSGWRQTGPPVYL